MNQVTPGIVVGDDRRGARWRRTSAAAPRPRAAEPVGARRRRGAATARARWPPRARRRRSAPPRRSAARRSPARARWRPRARRAPRCPRRAGRGTTRAVRSTLSTRARLQLLARAARASCSSVGSPSVMRTVRPSRASSDLVARPPQHLGGDGLGQRLRDAERHVARRLVRSSRKLPTTMIGTGSVSGSSSSASTSSEACGHVGVDEHDVGRVGARQLERGLRVVGALALERARPDASPPRSARRRAPRCPRRAPRWAATPGASSRPLRRRRSARALARRRLAPGQRRAGRRAPARRTPTSSLAQRAELRAAVEHGERLLQRARHRLEAQEARARPERVQAAAQLVARRPRRRVVLERASSSRASLDLAPERRDEVGPRPSEPTPRGVPGVGRAARHDPLGRSTRRAPEASI